LSNFGVGAICVWGGEYLLCRTVVRVFNDTGAIIDECVVVFPNGRRISQRTLPVGGEMRATEANGGEGTVWVEVVQGENNARIEACGYITHGSGEYSDVHVKSGLAADVKKKQN
jgi:hypothetical protein